MALYGAQEKNKFPFSLEDTTLLRSLMFYLFLGFPTRQQKDRHKVPCKQWRNREKHGNETAAMNKKALAFINALRARMTNDACLRTTNDY